MKTQTGLFVFMANQPLSYGSWTNMKKRCNSPAYHHAYRYSGRGISYDPKWENFAGFYEDMGQTYKPGLTLERIDNDKDYSKSNCRWATRREQANNTRRNRWIKYHGVTKTLSQWARTYGLKRSTVAQRYYVYKWPLDRIFAEVNFG